MFYYLVAYFYLPITRKRYIELAVGLPAISSPLYDEGILLSAFLNLNATPSEQAGLFSTLSI